MTGTWNLYLKNGEDADQRVLKGVNWYRIVDYVTEPPIEVVTALKDGWRIEIERA